jgi:hypothetical protein
LGRISTENQSQTSNCEGSRATTLALMCASVAIVINKLSHLSDRVCNSCWRRKVRTLFQLFHLVKNSTKEESVQSPDRFVSNGNERLLFRSLSESPANRKVFRICLVLPLNLHREKRCFLQCKNRVNINQKIIFLRNI